MVLPTSDRHISPGEISPLPVDVEQKWLQIETAATAALTAASWERLNVQKWNRHPLGRGVRRSLLLGAVAAPALYKVELESQLKGAHL